MNDDPIVILAAARTPMGAFQGEFAALTAPQLGAHAIQAAVARAGMAGEDIDEVLMGCVLSAGVGQAPARQAALGTLLGALRQRGVARGVATLCIGGGEATAIAIERV